MDALGALTPDEIRSAIEIAMKLFERIARLSAGQ
jgi:hypothetical protein